MGWGRTASLLGVVVLVAACASAPRMTPAERLEFYRSHAGEPIRSISIHSRLWGWRSLGDSALTVWTRSDRGFLLELFGRCPDMAFAHSIGLTNRGGVVSAGFDSVVVPRRPGTGAASSANITCRIRTIRPIDNREVKESKRDLQEVDVIERDPAVEETPATEPAAN
jgi:Family of unknown function (DUF6491)